MNGWLFGFCLVLSGQKKTEEKEGMNIQMWLKDLQEGKRIVSVTTANRGTPQMNHSKKRSISPVLGSLLCNEQLNTGKKGRTYVTGIF